jgi:hypothetical protein
LGIGLGCDFYRAPTRFFCQPVAQGKKKDCSQKGGSEQSYNKICRNPREMEKERMSNKKQKMSLGMQMK